MTKVVLVSLTDIINDTHRELSKMSRTNKSFSTLKMFTGSIDNFIQIDLELSRSPFSPNSVDATIIIDNYCRAVDGVDHIIKADIYAKQYLKNNVINKNPPEVEITLHKFVAKDRANYLTYPQISHEEELLQSLIWTEWRNFLT